MLYGPKIGMSGRPVIRHAWRSPKKMMTSDSRALTAFPAKARNELFDYLDQQVIGRAEDGGSQSGRWQRLNGPSRRDHVDLHLPKSIDRFIYIRNHQAKHGRSGISRTNACARSLRTALGEPNLEPSGRGHGNGASII